MVVLILQQGDTITFNWQFVGIGQEQCFHDDIELPECESPMSVSVDTQAYCVMSTMFGHLKSVRRVGCGWQNAKHPAMAVSASENMHVAPKPSQRLLLTVTARAFVCVCVLAVLQVTAKDVSSAATSHTFTVKFTDVCGNTKVADYKYTQKVSPTPQHNIP